MRIQITRLPDINSYRQMPEGIDHYGRFSVNRNGDMNVLPLHSMHPKDTVNGGYWASDLINKILYLSPRNVNINFERFVEDIKSDGRINKIIRMAGLNHGRNK